jgi:hypothetical protein
VEPCALSSPNPLGIPVEPGAHSIGLLAVELDLVPAVALPVSRKDNVHHVAVVMKSQCLLHIDRVRSHIYKQHIGLLVLDDGKNERITFTSPATPNRR